MSRALERPSVYIDALRERICMALLASPQPMQDLVMAAKEVEAYITGPQSVPKASVKAAVNQKGTLFHAEITALVESRLNRMRVVDVDLVEPVRKSMQDPFGEDGQIIIKIEAK